VHVLIDQGLEHDVQLGEVGGGKVVFVGIGQTGGFVTKRTSVKKFDKKFLILKSEFTVGNALCDHFLANI
jgi:hypothetical protein